MMARKMGLAMMAESQQEIQEIQEMINAAVIPLRYCLFTPELQWHSRGKMTYLTGVAGGGGREGGNKDRGGPRQAAYPHH